MLRLGIRREDKPGERRAALAPPDCARLVRSGATIVVQPSAARVFADAEYAAAGAVLAERLDGCRPIVGVKEVPPDALRPAGAYLYFSHTTKGQPHNRAALGRLLALGCTLIDHERVTDGDGRRLLAFGRHAGRAGMVDALVGVGRRLRSEGIDSPFTRLEPCHRYGEWMSAAAALSALGRAIARDGLPPGLAPLCIGVAGYGNVARGVQDALDALGAVTLDPDDVRSGRMRPDPHTVYRATFREQHTTARRDATGFDVHELATHPERYESAFEPYLPRLGMLVSCVSWEPGRPRLVTCDWLEAAVRARRRYPRFIADLACDIGGAIECTVRTTDLEEPTFCWDALHRAARPGVAGEGPVVLAVDNLPSELAGDAAADFSAALLPLLRRLDAVDWAAADVASSGLPPELARATVVWRGTLTPPFRRLLE
jgi:alanine dehydrogenase/PNT-like protein